MEQEPRRVGRTGTLYAFLFYSTFILYFSCVTGRPLDRPVFCETGKLYNKDSVIELLLDRKKAQLNAEAEERLKHKKRSKVSFQKNRSV